MSSCARVAPRARAGSLSPAAPPPFRLRRRYFYYGLTASGIRPPPPFKAAVTAFQLSQFFSCIAHAALTLVLDEIPRLYIVVQVCYHIYMMHLFLPVLYGPKPPRSPEAILDVPATPTESRAMGARRRPARAVRHTLRS